MIVKEALRASSLFTVGGNAYGVEVIEHGDINDYDWVCYISGSVMDNNYWGNKSFPGINSSLLENMFTRLDTKIDYESLGYTTNALNVGLVVNTYMGMYHDAHNFLKGIDDGSGILCGDYIEVDDRYSIATPFTGVGTKVPTRIKSTKLAAAITLCKSPANTFVSLVGDKDGAIEVLGQGLERLRGFILGYLDIQPSANSVPIDMPVPFIWQHSASTPTMLKIVLSQKVDKPECLTLCRQYKANVYLACFLYNLLEVDHGYLGLNVLQSTRATRSWCIHSTSTVTPVPYRYPLLVHLLSSIHDYYTTKEEATKDTSSTAQLDLPLFGTLLQRWGNGSHFSIMTTLGNTAARDSDLYKLLPSIARGFCVRLYRLTCKGVITMPSKKMFPRRSEASRAFAAVYEDYTKRRSLGDYLDLSNILVINAVSTAAPLLRDITCTTSIDLYQSLLSDFDRPAIPVKGAVNTDTFPTLLNYSKYYSRMDRWQGVKVVNEWGIEISVTEQLQKITIDLLDKLHEQLGTSDKYTYITLKQVAEMYDYWGFNNSAITPDNIQDSLMGKVTFNKGCIKGLSLKCLIDYHQCHKHPATTVLLDTVRKLLQSTVMEGIEGSTDLVGEGYSKRAVKLCVIEYLSALLDSTGVQLGTV